MLQKRAKLTPYTGRQSRGVNERASVRARLELFEYMVLRTPCGVKRFCVCNRAVYLWWIVCRDCVWPPKLKVETCTHTYTHTQTNSWTARETRGEIEPVVTETTQHTEKERISRTPLNTDTRLYEQKPMKRRGSKEREGYRKVMHV